MEILCTKFILSRSFLIFLTIVVFLSTHLVYTLFFLPFDTIPNSLDFAFVPFFPSHNITSSPPFPPRFPELVWQTWKEPYSDQKTQSWKRLNHEFNYTLVVDEEAENFVYSRFYRKEDKPIRETYHNMNDPVLKADFFRYLLIYSSGGVYADMDTSNLKPIKQWIPTHINKTQVNLVVGVEIDEPNASSADLKKWVWVERFQLCQWTFMGKPGHPAIALLIEKIVQEINRLANRERRSLRNLRKLSKFEVLALTGPAAFTWSIQNYLTQKTGRKVDWYDMTDLTTPKLIADVLILPITAFAPGQRHSKSGSKDDEQALVFHHFGFSGWAKKREWWRRIF